jgi:UbiD family decarboxylase
LPLFRVNPYDGGFYIAKAGVVSRDPLDPEDFGKQTVGVYRVQVHGPDRVSIMSAASHDLSRQIIAAERDDLPLKVALMIGNHPAMTLFAGTPLGYEESEFEYAAGVMGDALRITSSSTGLDVLADSEMVIEAELLNGERVPEGPFGEFTATYTDTAWVPLFQVTGVSSRTEPIFENIYLGAGWGELDTLIGLNTCVPVYEDLRKMFPEVRAVNALYQHGLTAIIAVRNRFGGFAKSVAHHALGLTHGLQYLKNIILVDEDVDPFDLESVMWSLSTRTRPDDVIVLPDLPLIPLDPSALVPGKGHRLIIDATKFTPPDPASHSFQIEPPPSDRLEQAIEALAQARPPSNSSEQGSSGSSLKLGGPK